MTDPTRRPRSDFANDKARQGRILIVDADGEARSRLRTLLSGEGYAAETFAWSGALLDAPLPEAPSCIVVDVGSPAAEGLDLIERLKSRGEPLPVIFISDSADVTFSVRAMKAGAVDFLPRSFARQDLLSAVQCALELDTKRRSKAQLRRAVTQRFETLTPREQEVMDGVVRGLMNKQIAWELEISEITVKLHRSSMMRKMELRSVPDLVRASLWLAA